MAYDPKSLLAPIRRGAMPAIRNRIDIVFVNGNALLHCKSCDNFLVWNDKEHWFECSECYVDVLPEEALALTGEAEESLGVLRAFAKRKVGKSWRLEKFFRWLLSKAR